jgi:digeranylgeranylglycerophospholipid reductase
MDKTGLAIVGASVAGLAAAIAAAREGVDVTLLEAKKEIGVPPAPAITGLDSLWPKAIELPAHAVTRRLAGSVVRGSDGRGPYVDTPLSLVDRTRFDQHLAEVARKAGARILTGVEGIDVRPDRTVVAPGLELKSDLLLFADGARTQATRFLRTTKDPGALQWGAVLTFEAPEPESDGRYYITLGPHAPGGRSQLNPLGNDRWSHWTFFRGDPAQAEAVARRAFALDARLMGPEWEKVEPRFAGYGPDPLYTIPDQLVGNGVMATGGAAGQGGLETGLAAGWMAGSAAGRFLSGKGTLDEYVRAWHKRYQRSYERVRRSNDALMRLTDVEVRDVVGAWHGHHVGAKPSPALLFRNPRGILALLKASRIAKSRA